MPTATKTLIRARVDGRRKKKAETIFRRYGLTTSEAVNIFLAKVEEVDGLPFDLRPNLDGPLLSTAEIGKQWEDAFGAY